MNERTPIAEPTVERAGQPDLVAEPDEAPNAAMMLMLDKLCASAAAEGAAHERARIASIMNSCAASANLLLAWRLAESGAVSREAAEQALLVSHFSRLAPPAGASGAPLHH